MNAMPAMKPLRRPVGVALGLLVIAAGVASAHDLFLRARSYFLAPHAAARIDVLNGTFERSEAALAFNRLTDLRIAGPSGTTPLGASAWRVHGDSAEVAWSGGDAGTWVVGASVAPRELTLTADQFNEYLKEDGIPDVLEARRKSGELGKPARERYAKNVKAVLQVGDARTASYATVFGHPAELVPLHNPYDLQPGASFRVRALVDGQPVANQTVLAGGVDTDGNRIVETATRTGADGVATVRITRAGTWYVKFIHMTRVTGDPKLDYRSKWATLTFGVR
jgi:hypothetical protein